MVLEQRKTALLRRIEQEWQRFFSVVGQVPLARLQEPGAEGVWSVQDVVGHIAPWEHRCILALQNLLAGGKLVVYVPRKEIECLNQAAVEDARALSADHVLAEMRQVHRELIAFLEVLPPPLFKGRLLQRLRLDTYGHYAKHTVHLERWLTEKGLTGSL